MAYLIKRFRRMPRHSLGRQVMSVLGTAMLIILVAFTAGATYFVYRTEGISWQGRQSEAARNAAGAMAAIVRRAQDTLAVVSIIDTEILKLHQDDLGRLLNQNPTLEEVIRLDAEGHMLMDAHRDRSVLAQLITIPQPRWFLDARSGQPYLGPVQLSYNEQPYLLMAIPAPDGGVVAARVQISVLWEAVADIRFGQAGRAYVITREGDIVAHTHPEVVLTSTSISGRSELAALLTAPNAEWHGAYINFEGASVVGATAPVPDTDWVVITELPQAEAFAASRTALLALGGGLLILMAMTAGVVARFVERLVVQPMAQLREGANRIGQGDLNYRIGFVRRDEIGQLAKAFDEMAKRLYERDAQISAQTSALRISEARYRAIVEDQTELICRYMSDGTLTFVNEAYCRYFGQTREALIGHAYAPLIPAEDHPLVEAFVARLGRENPVEAIEHRVVLPDGSIRWQHWTDRAILDDHGRVVEFQAVGRDVTERKQMETALRESEKLYRLLADNATDVIWVRDMNLRPTYTSPAVQNLRGFTPEEALTQALNDILTPASVEVAQQFFLEILMTAQTAPLEKLRSQSRTLELEFKRKDGSLVWTESQMSFLLDEQGQPSGILGVTRDISERRQAADELRRLNLELEDRVQERTADLVRVNTDLTVEVAERQRAEAALRESETRLRRIADNMLDLIVQTDDQARYVYASPSHKSILGYEAQDLLGQSIFEKIHPDDSERALTVTAQALGASSATQMELRYRHAQGHYVWIESVGNPLFDDQGRIVGSIIGSRDITERKRAEDLLRQAEAKYRTLVENIPAAVFIWELSEAGACLYISPQIEGMLGFSVEEWLADPELWRKQLHPDDRDRAIADDAHTLATDEPLHSEYRLLARDGRAVWVRDEGVVMSDEAGQPRLNQGYLLDITKQKQAEAQIQESLREKEVLLKEIHHRVKNNLQIISSLLSLQSNTVADSHTLEILRESQNRVKSMALVHEKLYRSSDLARIDFAEYVRSLTAQLFRTYSTVSGTVALTLNIENIWLDVDTSIPCGLIINELVSNALKHAFPGGQEGEIGVAACDDGDGRILLRVSDTGVGFPAAIDFRNTPSLGLQLVNTLADQIGGVLELNRGRGTEFRIIFKAPAFRTRS